MAKPKGNEDADLYPPSLDPPPDLIHNSGAYTLRVVLVLLSLLFFLVLYLGLVSGSAYLTYYLWELDVPSGSDSGKYWIAKVAGIICSAMLFLFLLKGLFHGKRATTDTYFPISERDAPQLYSFVRKLCQDVGAPFPNKIFLTHDVNAAVFYPRTLLSLVLPRRKNLLIGLGLVNVVSLSEFKAVLAHEFGHFAQSSMKLGQYVYIANQVIGDLVFSRDKWDEFLATWCVQDIRISFPAWIITGIVWVLRQLLGVIFKVINLLNLALSRQMEFDADLQAVRLTGSDALISGLWKLERSGLALQMAQGDLYSMSQHGKYSDDLFLHQTQALGRLHKLIEKKGTEVPPDVMKVLQEGYEPGEEVQFPYSEEERESAWHTHPPNHLREVNVKRVYVEHDMDERPAWVLIPDSRSLRAEVTRLSYEEILGKRPARKKLSPASDVAALIAEEQAEMHQADHYHGYYDDRFVQPGDVAALARELDATWEGADKKGRRLQLARTRKDAAQYSSDRLQKATKQFVQRQGEIGLLLAIEGMPRGQAKKGTFEFRGKEVPLARARRLRSKVDDELTQLETNFAKADKAFFRYFYVRAQQKDQTEELLGRYTFLVEIQGHVKTLNDAENKISPILQVLQSGAELSEGDVEYIRSTFRQGRRALKDVVESSQDLIIPELKHIEEGATVASFVLPGKLVRSPPRDLTGEWIADLLQQLGEASSRVKRLHFKNLGALLKLQEGLDPMLFPQDEADDAPAPPMEDPVSDFSSD